jgi:A118 family predicted phage portal protein
VPLPANGTPWPPAELAPVQGKYAEWGAWYSGDPERLLKTYQQAQVIRPSLRPAQLQGGFVGSIARFFWGTPNTTNMPKQKLHVPIAGDLCQATGDLLFAEEPTLTAEGASTEIQDRLNDLLDDGNMSVLAEGGEIGAAFGDAYMRVTWDPALLPRPFLTAVHADAAYPEFRWGRLVAVTFWHIVRTDGQQVWRHLERHELDSRGIGIILHGLYRGTATDLGMAIALTEAPQTAGIVLNDQGVISTETPGLAVVHAPNQRPQRRWRNEPLASNFGRSDLDGIEGLMDALDETYTSWMRDVRLGKARLLIGDTALEALGPGKGQAFDTDREVFTGLQLPPASGKDGGSGAAQIAQAVQFGIRFAEHQATADELLAKILRTAGYSTQTFGDSTDVATTATEVQARERRTYMTRDRKIRLWRPVVEQLFTKLLSVDNALFRGPGTAADIDCAFADGVQESLLNLAQTAQAMETAQAASTKVKVQLLHPDWDDQQVDAEVALIKDQVPKVPDPFTALPPGADPTADPAVQSTDAGQP